MLQELENSPSSDADVNISFSSPVDHLISLLGSRKNRCSSHRSQRFESFEKSS